MNTEHKEKLVKLLNEYCKKDCDGCPLDTDGYCPLLDVSNQLKMEIEHGSKY